MLFDSIFRKELARSFMATLVVLLTIVITIFLIRTLGRASTGRVNPSEVLLVMGFIVLGHLASILTLSLFVAITATLTRMYANSEMVVWFSSGQGLFSFLRPLLQFAWPIVLVILVLSLLVWPWSQKQSRLLTERYQSRGDIERVAPGQFIESASGNRVFFIDKDTPADNVGTDIFIWNNELDAETVVSAQKGEVQKNEHGQTLLLYNGSRLQIQHADGQMQTSDFARYSSLIEVQEPQASDSISMRQSSSMTLLHLGTPPALAELSWRLGLVWAAINCVLMALAIARVDPRGGRSSSLILALLCFTTYYNLISVGQNWIARDHIPMSAYMLLLHGGITLAALAWIRHREQHGRQRKKTAPLVATKSA